MNDLIDEFHMLRFGAPWLLLLLLLLPLWAWLRGRFGAVAAVQYSSGKLLQAAARKSRFSPGRLKMALRYLALALLIGALARPQMEKGLADREAMGINIMLVFDFSGTMKTRDFSLDNRRVSRIEAMKKVGSEFIRARAHDRIGVVRFDAGAVLVSPLTLDHEWLLSRLALEEADQGTAPGSGMLIAAEALLPAKDQAKVIITLTDADQVNQGPEPEEVAKAIAPLGIKNHVIQIIDFAQMQQVSAGGQVLSEVARITGGQFFKVSDVTGLRNVYRQIDQLEKAAFKENKQTSWREVMAWLTVPGLALLLLEVLVTQIFWRRLP